MPFIAESTIDQIAAQLDGSPEKYESTINDFQQQQPVLLSWLFSEEFRVLTQEEQQYFLYLTLVIWQSIGQVIPQIPMVKTEQLEVVEEKNWTSFQNAAARTFRDKLDVFFKNYEQEDLLAFVEDALTLDEDDFLTKEGREPMFIALKTIIDILCKLE